MQAFKVIIQEIPNRYIDRSVNYRQEFQINALCATEAKQRALDNFGDYSRVVSCMEIDHGYPEETLYALTDDE